MRTKFFFRVLATIAFALPVLSAQGEEKNGLLVSITKKTLARNDSRGLDTIHLARTQGLALTIKNNSIKDFPAGEVQWTILVRKAYEGGLLQKYSGKEALPALHPSGSAELVLGAAQTEGYRSDFSGLNYKDKLEYEVVITHGGKETMRTSSDPNFTVLAKNATNMDRGRSVSPEPTVVPPTNIRPAPVRPAPVRPTPVPLVPPAPPRVNPTPKPANVTPPAPPVNPTPAPPAATPVEPRPPTPPATGSDKPFDFFNVGKDEK